MEKFNVRLEFGGDVIFSIMATSPDKAASQLVGKVNNQKGLIAQRVSGSRGMSGWFQGMRSMGNGVYTSTGPRFLVQ